MDTHILLLFGVLGVVKGLGGRIILRDVRWEGLLRISVGRRLALVLDHHLDNTVLHEILIKNMMACHVILQFLAAYCHLRKLINILRIGEGKEKCDGDVEAGMEVEKRRENRSIENILFC